MTQSADEGTRCRVTSTCLGASLGTVARRRQKHTSGERERGLLCMFDRNTIVLALVQTDLQVTSVPAQPP